MRIAIDRTRLQAIIIGVPLVLCIAAGSYYYFFIRPRTGVTHEAFLVPDTAVRAVLKPVLVQDYVSSLAPTATRFVKGVPKFSSLQQFSFRTEWIHKMPFEFTFLLDQRSPDFLGVILYVQEHPAAEAFDDLVNDSGFFRALYPIQWESSRMLRQGENHLLAMATLPIPSAARDGVSRSFPDYVPFDPPEVTGSHFAEIAINNQNGALMELQGALPGLVGVLNNPALETKSNAFWPKVAGVYFTADLEEPNRVSMTLEVTLTDPGAVNETATLLDEAAAGVADYLSSRFGFSFGGTARPDGADVISGTYLLTGFETRLRSALGG